MRTVCLAVLALSLVSMASASAQVGPTGTVQVATFHDSGVETNSGTELVAMHRFRLTDPGAASLRVLFGVVTLGPSDFVEVYSPLDGERHELDRVELQRWEFTSGYFNGDTLDITLYLAPGSSGRLQIVGYLKGVGIPGSDTICGTDDRVPSTDNRVARFVTSNTATGGGCTIWLCSADSCMISAGHCFAGGTLMVAEFNVPPSFPNGSLQHPPIEDQFTIDPTTVVSVNGGLGNDWGVCRVNPNNLGQTAASRFGFLPLGFFVPNPGDVTRITGCGTDDNADNQTLQTNTGPFSGASGTQITYVVDTTGGNSGSPVIDEASGQAVGVHTNGGCTATGGANSGTSLLNVSFQNAVLNLCSFVPSQPVASFTPGSPVSIAATQSITFTSTSTGVPDTFAWDFDGDAVVDATTAGATFTYGTPGIYDVTLTVSNGIGSDTLTIPMLVTVRPISPASIPHAEDFSGGLPASGEWIFESEGAGRIAAGSSGTPSPVSGSPSMTMDSAVANGPFVTNSAILLVDLATAGSAVLSYWFKLTGDESHPEDGVFLSDGTTEVLARSHQGGPTTWTNVVLDVDQIATNAGLAFSPAFQIIFRQRDNSDIPTDGLLVDDIVVALDVADTGQPNTPGVASFAIDGSVDQRGITPTPIQNGPFFATKAAGDGLAMTFQGPPGQPLLLLFGPLNRSNAIFLNVGQLDIGLRGPSDLGDINILLDGAMPAGLLDLLANTGPTGTQQLAFTLPPLASGVFGTFQTVVFQPAGPPRLTAATELSIR